MIGEYSISKTLGQGKYGKVVLGIKEDQGYAIKILSKKHLRRKVGSNSISSIAREIQILKKIEHRNIVTLFEIIDDVKRKNICLVLEYVDAGPLITLDLKKIQENVHHHHSIADDASVDGPFEPIVVCKPMSMIEARTAFRQLLLGLEFLHESGIIHRDIKPDNILITKSGIVKISDFGVSDILFDSDFIRSTEGTPLFTAPEMCLGKPFQGKPTDIWALGVTFYLMLFGCFPYGGRNVFEIYHNIKNKPLRFPNTHQFIDPHLVDLISGMLEKDPHERFTVAELKEHNWVTSFNRATMPTTFENVYSPVDSVNGSETRRSRRPEPRVMLSLRVAVLVYTGIHRWANEARSHLRKWRLKQRYQLFFREC